MLKRITDIFDMFGVASVAIGLYKEGDAMAPAIGVAFLAARLELVRLGGKDE